MALYDNIDWVGMWAEGKTYADMVRIVGCDPKTVRRYCNRAVDQLSDTEKVRVGILRQQAQEAMQVAESLRVDKLAPRIQELHLMAAVKR